MKNRKIIRADLFFSQCGTHKYHCLWTGDWEEIDLITAIDNRKFDNPTEEDLTISHFGGRIENYRVNQDGTQEGVVCVYYD